MALLIKWSFIHAGFTVVNLIALLTFFIPDKFVVRFFRVIKMNKRARWMALDKITDAAIASATNQS